MSSSQHAVAIIRTKLYRLSVPANYINRDVLDTSLEAGFELPLTVVSAPAGYGKSTLISHWLQNRGTPSAWLSLDESDSDIRVFLTYIVAALRTVSTEACEETLNIVNAESLPPLHVVAGVLSNDLDELDERLTLVLDDYHRIKEPAVHTLLDTLLAHPPRYLHLVISSRRDPQLSLASLRAHQMCTEIRMRELEFSTEETDSCFRQVIRQPVDQAVINRLQDITRQFLIVSMHQSVRLSVAMMMVTASHEGQALHFTSNVRLADHKRRHSGMFLAGLNLPSLNGASEASAN